MLPNGIRPIPIDDETSATIKAARVLCIFFMVYVHVNPGLDSFENLQQLSTSLWVFHTLLSDVLGRASVPALSVISGFLAVHTLNRRHFGKYVSGRVKTILLPMATWNAIGVVFAFAVFMLVGKANTLMTSMADMPLQEILLGKILALDYTAAYASQNFLRDIFVCALLSPLIVLAVNHLGWSIPVILVVAAETLGFEPIIYRPPILIFFSFGVLVALKVGHFRWLFKGRYLIAASFLFVVLIEFHGYGSPMYDLLKRAVVSSAIILVSISAGRAATTRWLLHLEPHIYFIFLSHNFIFGLFWGAWIAVFGEDISRAYHFFYLLAPLILVLTIYSIHGVTARLPGIIRIPLAGK